MAVHEAKRDTSANYAQPNVDAQQPNTVWGLRGNQAAVEQFVSPLKKVGGGEIVRKFITQIDKIIKDTAQPNWKVTMTPVTDGTHYSHIVLAVANDNYPGKVAYSIMVLTATNNDPPNESRNLGGGLVDILRLPTDAVDAALKEIVEAKLRPNWVGQELIYTTAFLVPKQVNPDNEDEVKTWVGLATEAAGYKLASLVGTPDLNLTKIQKETLSIRTDAVKETITSPAGLPIQSHITVRTSGLTQQDRRDQPRSLNTGGAIGPITEIKAASDLIWVGSTTNDLYNQQPNQPYLPQFIITSMSSEIPLGYQPGALLFSLYTMMVVYQNHVWAQCFKPTVQDPKRRDLRDLAPLIKESFRDIPPDTIPTRGPQLTPERFHALIAKLFRPYLMLSMDVELFGPHSWPFAVFVDAMREEASPGTADKHGYKAKKILLRAANELSGNLFQNYFQFQENIFIEHNHRVHMGKATIEGEVVDLRAVDSYLHIANTFADSLEIVKEWAETHYPSYTGTNLEARLDKQRKILQLASGNTAVFTGWADRLSFHPKFIAALADSVRASGIDFTTDTASADMYQQRLGFQGANSFAFLAGREMMNMNYAYGGVGRQNPLDWSRTIHAGY